MSRTAFKTIEGTFEKEVSFGGCKGASMWRFDYIFFIIRSDGLDKCLADVSCFRNSFELCCNCNKKFEFDGGDDGGEAVTRAPVVGVFNLVRFVF